MKKVKASLVTLVRDTNARDSMFHLSVFRFPVINKPVPSPEVFSVLVRGDGLVREACECCLGHVPSLALYCLRASDGDACDRFKLRAVSRSV